MASGNAVKHSMLLYQWWCAATTRRAGVLHCWRTPKPKPVTPSTAGGCQPVTAMLQVAKRVPCQHVPLPCVVPPSILFFLESGAITRFYYGQGVAANHAAHVSHSMVAAASMVVGIAKVRHSGLGEGARTRCSLAAARSSCNLLQLIVTSKSSGSQTAR